MPAAARSSPVPPLNLIAANGLPAPPPDRPAVPVRCPPLDPLAVTEQTPLGRLPRIDNDGCLPWLAHAAAFDAGQTRPRVAILVQGLGRNAFLTQRAIDELPASVSLGFAPDAPYLDRWIERARARGHEALVILPVPAPDVTVPTLRMDAAAPDNPRRLLATLARAGTGYVGVVLPAATLPNAAEVALRPLLQEIADRGLLLLEVGRVDRLAAPLSRELGMPYGTDSGVIDRDPGRGDVAANLRALEAQAVRQGVGLGVGTVRRETIDGLIAWARELDSRGLVLAPASAVVTCADLCAERLRKAKAIGAP